VALSRSRYAAAIYTDDKVKMPHVLAREVTQQTAIQARRAPAFDMGHAI
jgi:hypothetical protein